jgi:hypothetical protein
MTTTSLVPKAALTLFFVLILFLYGSRQGA